MNILSIGFEGKLTSFGLDDCFVEVRHLRALCVDLRSKDFSLRLRVSLRNRSVVWDIMGAYKSQGLVLPFLNSSRASSASFASSS